MLRRLADGHSVVDDDYRTHVTPGRPSRVENSLHIMSERGWIDWSEGVSDIAITAAGRAALAPRKGSTP